MMALMDERIKKVHAGSNYTKNGADLSEWRCFIGKRSNVELHQMEDMEPFSNCQDDNDEPAIV
jgi:hypothetical protein